MEKNKKGTIDQKEQSKYSLNHKVDLLSLGSLFWKLNEFYSQKVRNNQDLEESFLILSEHV